MTHRGDPAAWCAGSGGKYRELVLEGNQGRLKKCGFRLECTKRAGTVPLTEIVVIPCPSCLPSNTRASLCVKRGEDTLVGYASISVLALVDVLGVFTPQNDSHMSKNETADALYFLK